MGELPKICLNMIVKNESKIITRLLDSVLKIIDHYVIVDTGSTDNTIEVISNYFKDKSIDGKILVKKFENFEKTRSYALEKCLCEPDSDFILLLDADMKLEFGEKFDPIKLKQLLIFDAYHLMQGNETLMYKNIRLVRNSLHFFYKGVTHEYVTSHSKFTKGTIDKEMLFINDIGDGGSKDDKYTRDIDLLQKALDKEPNNNRYKFYLANSYKDNKQYEKAIECYDKCIAGNGWDQEIWCSKYYKGKCYKELGNTAEALECWLLAFEYMPKRLEPIYEIILHYRNSGKHLLAYHFYKIALEHINRIENEDDELFLVKNVYNYKLDYEITIVGFYLGLDKFSINTVCMNLLNKEIPGDIQGSILSNYKFYGVNLSDYKCKSKLQTKLLDIVGKGINMKHTHEYHSSTPSICFYQDKLICLVRYVNYYLDEKGHYKSKNKNGNYIDMEGIITRNMCGVFTIKNNALELEKEFEVKYDTTYDTFYKGTEDMRLININNEEIYFTGNKITQYPNLNIHIEYGKLDIEKETTESCLLNIENKAKIEKNWVVFSKEGKQYIVYNWFPMTICSFDETLFDETLQKYDVSIERKIAMPNIFKSVRGSTNGITIGNEIWFITHCVSYEIMRYYYHMFVVLDKDTMELKRYTQLCSFNKNRIEYTLGFEYLEKEDKFLIGYSNHDSTPDYICIKKSIIEELMYDNTKA